MFLCVCRYQGYHSPYYHDGHRAFRAKMRKFIEEEIKPNIDKWVDDPNGYPRELHVKAFKVTFKINFGRKI